jgi:DNA polymerase-3 subunit gamma/tau
MIPMNESRVIALRFRPKTFDQVVGQEAIVRTLTNAITSGQVHSAYVFAGARGVGKTTAARLLAKGLNCDHGRTIQPCGVCPSCRDISESRSMFVIEIDAATNTGIDNVRDVIIGSAGMHPPVGKHSVFIIDEVHQLSPKAFDALLKTLEEPLPNVVFIMATTELQKVPDTILSRCQVFEFRSIPLPKVFGELKRIAGELAVTVSDSALGTIARAGEGSLRDAESAFDQVISFAGSNISEEDVSVALGLPGFETLRATVEAIADQDTQAILRIVDTIVTRGYDIRNFCREVMTYIRNLLVVKVAGFDPELTQMPHSEADRTSQLADRFSDQDLIRFFSILSKTEQDIRLSSQPRFQLEIGLVKMAQANRLYLIEEAIDRMAAIETSLRGQSGLDPTSPPRSAPVGIKSDARVAEPTKTTGSGKTAASGKTSMPGRTTASGPITDEPPSASEGGAPKSSAGAQAPNTPDHITPSEVPAANLQPGAQENGASGAEVQPNRSSQHSSSSPGASDKAAASIDTSVAEAAHHADDPKGMIDKVKRKLESRNKILLSVALDHAKQVSVDENYFKVSYDPSDTGRHYKAQIEDARRILEEVCYEALGKRLTLSASVGGSPSPPRPTPDSIAPTKPKAQAGDTAPEDHPAVRAIIERFNGEIIDVDVPDR